MRRLNGLSGLFLPLVAGAFLGCGGGAAAGEAPGNPVDGGISTGGTGATPRSTGGSTGVVVQQTGGTDGGTVNCGGNNTTGCQAKVPEGCGDGINNQGGIEQCDDDNTVPGDGCSGACKVEPNWDCPPAGACTPKVICGDSRLGPGEVCDDGNAIDGDGCNAACNYQDPAFSCVVGQPCVRLSSCGNKRIESGENCDDGNSQAGDGCAANCVIEDGWVCPQPGAACRRAGVCGDKTVNTVVGEVCDDGNTVDGDGCSGDCREKQAGCLCTPGQLCKCPEVRCGNGTREGAEACDDKNTSSGDGCSADCSTVESGYDCPFTGAPCVPKCGDGIILQGEQCDPGVSITDIAQACSSTCRWNAGWACSSSSCHKTTCGDGNKEGQESCDDGNTNPGDGCSPTCKVEPSCSAATGTCTSICGDGIVMPAQPDGAIKPGGTCDDGNNLSNDGCSSDCKVEPGYQCEQPALADNATMTVPVTYRDFRFGGDFEPAAATGEFDAATGLVRNTLDDEGKPVLVGTAGQGYITNATSFANWYRTVSGTNAEYKTTLTLFSNGRGGFVNHMADGSQFTGYANARWCPDATCQGCNPYPAGVTPGTVTKCLSTGCTPWGATSTQPCIVDIVAYEGSPLFFPLDNVPGMITPASEYKAALITPAYGGSWSAEPGDPAPLHNFSFTSEVRYWFGYVASKQYVLDFTGDDDVWVFINRRLAVDLGGIHTPVNGRIELNANGGGTVTITQTEPNPPPASIVQTVELGMQDGGVYEIAVFQAERRTTASTYKLTLSGFNDAPSECKPICGDGVVSPGEQCDNGDQNLGGYNKCTPDCRLGPYCGDKNVDSPDEVCDDGVNDDDYGSLSGCSPRCQLPPRCGDGVVQVEYAEECDDGVNDGHYGGGCTSTCQNAGYCGDGVIQGTESCDDGINDGSYTTCGDPSQPLPNCGRAPKCLDGIVQADYGEECEPSASDDPNCTQACRLPGGCGDGIRTDPEQCDLGEINNNGEYGGCAPSCVYAPHCGDGIKNGPEECDNGKDESGKNLNDGSYGGCTAECKLAPHCGDGITSDGEECDNGAKNGTDLICTESCKKIIYVTT